MLRRSAWTIVNPYPPLSRAVVTVAPHTSNLDFFVGISASWALDLKPSFIGKHTLFHWPLGPIMRALGGIPVHRKKSVGFVDRMAAMVGEHDRIALIIAPEGTRKQVDRWKSGFYHIARLADVPIVPAYLDWSKKTIGFGAPFHPTGDAEADISTIREFYAEFEGRK